MISKDKTYRTRDGREVRIYATDGGVGKSMVHGATLDEAPGWFPRVWYPDGSHIENDYFDLIEVKPRIKRTVWLNVYANSYEAHHTKDFCNDLASVGKGRLACVKVEIYCEEGDGL